MFFSFLILPLVLHFIRHTTSLPAGPLGNNADGTITLPNLGGNLNLSSSFAPLMFPSNPNPTLTGPNRPGDNHIWPEVSAAQYYIKFSHYGADLSQSEGKGLLYVFSLIAAKCLSTVPYRISIVSTLHLELKSCISHNITAIPTQHAP